MSLVIMSMWENQSTHVRLDWVKPDEHKILIAYDPPIDCCKGLFSGQPIVLREWGGHKWYFSVSEGAEVQPTDMWRSDSDGSGMLYPWYWNLKEGYDIVCQIAPPNSVSSVNSHEKTIECFAPVQNDGHTFLRVGNELKPLTKEVKIDLGIPHQIVRRGEGYSVQLLKMSGRVRFPSREDHVFCKQPDDDLLRTTT